MAFDLIRIQVSERYLIIDAIMIVAKFKGVDIDLVIPQMIRDSSAGARGGANPKIGDWQEQATVSRAVQDSAEIRQKVLSIQQLVSEQLAILKQRARDVRNGIQPVGLVRIGDGGNTLGM